MLGQPLTMLLPPVVGLRLSGELPEGTTATDLVLTITELLRRHGVVGQVRRVLRARGGRPAAREPGHHRQHVARVRGHLHDLPDRRQDPRLPALHRARRGPPGPGRGLRQGAGPVARTRRRRAGLLRAVELDLATVAPSLAGPARPQDRVAWPGPGTAYRQALGREPRGAGDRPPLADGDRQLADGDVVIAAITSCTNTSNPQVLVAAGLLAQQGGERGLSTKPWVKTSLAPGSRVVMDYLERAGLIGPLEQLGFYLVGFGCTTCIGNSGPLLPGASPRRCSEHELSVVSVLSGNRNFEGRIHPDVRMNYLASPPLVVAYALAGTMDIDLTDRPAGHRHRRPAGHPGRPVAERRRGGRDHPGARSARTMFRSRYASVFEGDELWQGVPVGRRARRSPGTRLDLRAAAPFFEGMTRSPAPVDDIVGRPGAGRPGRQRHHRPHLAGRLDRARHAGRPVPDRARRRAGRLQLLRGPPGQPRGDDAGHLRQRPPAQPAGPGDRGRGHPAPARRRPRPPSTRRPCGTRPTGVPLVVLAGKEYGSGSSRDWAAKGTVLLGVRAVDRRELRADPPVEPGRAWACCPSSTRTASRPSLHG